MTDHARFLRAGMNRRSFLKASAAGAALATVPGLGLGRALAQEGWTLALSARSLSNPYHATFAKGGEDFAKSVGLPYEILITEGNSEKGIADIRALLARTGGKLVLNVDPNDSPDARVIVEDVQAAGGYVVTQWNKPDDLHPWDHNPNYVAHMSFDGVPNGKAMGEALIASMGGSGGIVALGGILSNVPAIERKLGLDQAIAENPNVTLLDFQAADWNETKAFEITQAWLTRFGDDIKGVFAANDGMAIGALEALRQEGKAGAVPVTGIDGIEAALFAIEAGEMAGTVAWDPNWTGGIGLALGHAVALGEIDIAAEPHEHREFYGTGIVVTPANLAEYRAMDTALDFGDFWGKSPGQIQYRG